MDRIRNFLNYDFKIGDSIHITIQTIIIVIAVLVITAVVMKYLKRIVTKRLPDTDSQNLIQYSLLLNTLYI